MSIGPEVAPLDVAMAAGTMVAVRRKRTERAWVLDLDGPTAVLTVDSAMAATMHEGDEVELRVGIREGAAWFVEGEVTSITFQSDGATLHVRTGGQAERRQQREHLRIPAFDVELALRRLRGSTERTWFQADGFDISAGGIRFSSAEPLGVGEVFDCRLQLPSPTRPVEVETEGVIVWGHAGEHARPRIPHYALAFHDLSGADEDRIVGWVLQRQTARPGS